MKFVRGVGLVTLSIILSQTLEGCQQGEPSPVICSDRPQATLTNDRVEEIQLTTKPTTRSGHSSPVQPLGYKFTAKTGQIIKYQIDNPKVCAWLYDPNGNFVKEATLTKDGIYLLHLAQAEGTGAFNLTLSLSLPPKPLETSSPVSTSTKPSKYVDPSTIEPPKIKSKPPQPRSTPKLRQPIVPTIPQPSKLTEKEARNLIEKWLVAKQSLFGPKPNLRSVEKLVTGSAYQEHIKKESQTSKDRPKDLSPRVVYYTYEKQQVDKIAKIQEYRRDRFLARAIVTEHGTVHNIKTGITKTFHGNRQSFCYEFTEVDGEWKISRTPQLIKDCRQ